jgi:hypothetical protein
VRACTRRSMTGDPLRFIGPRIGALLAAAPESRGAVVREQRRAGKGVPRLEELRGTRAENLDIEMLS